ncbi:MAG TPA: nitrous oxide reductase accessory protein NosL [Sandaracinaceae bacterium LLY-WYZ-13_1]|nr:nitrous oxide reductase accessory protein NosL [Sandaracinaceae bacterium LLY-WYZ-13_1]
MRARLFSLLAPTLALVLVLACGDDESDGAGETTRCDQCGMVVEPDSGWRAGGEGLAFDTPKCLFRHRHREGDVPGAWVIEYYSQERRPAVEVLYVIGTDLEGPMGRDLVPVEGRDAAERLMADHQGERILGFDEVSQDVVDGLFRPRP